MASNISINPLLTSVAAGSFLVSTKGFVQGTMLDDPTVRNLLAGGVLASTETLPMWGGLPVQELIPTAGNGTVGPNLKRATTISNYTGFSVFNQAANWVTSPQSEAPSAAPGMTVPFFRKGSNARIAVQMDPVLVDLNGGLISQQVSWDFNNGVLQPYTGTATYALSSITWASTNGGRLTVVGSVATPVGAIGDQVNISGATNSGTGGTAVINTNFVVDTFTDNEHFTLAAPAAAGVFGTIGGSPVLNYDSGALAVDVLETFVGNCLTITYDPVNNYVHWNQNGSCAIILL